MDRIQEWVAFVGRRNIAYVVFVSLLVPFGMLLDAAGPRGPDSGGGIMAVIILWSVVSLIFFKANAGLAIGSIVSGRSATGALLCAMRAFRPTTLSFQLLGLLVSSDDRLVRQRDQGSARWMGRQVVPP
jgi:hypothetical protein